MSGGAKIIFIRDQELETIEAEFTEITFKLSVYNHNRQMPFRFKDQAKIKEDVRDAIRKLVRLDKILKIAVILLLLFDLREAVAAEDQQEAKCESQARWGYFRPLVYGGPAIDLWAPKDLHGKFKTREECEADRAKYNKANAGQKCDGNLASVKGCYKGAAKKCQARIVGAGIKGVCEKGEFWAEDGEN